MRNLQSDIDISVWHTKNINTTVKNDPQALSVNVFDHSELELLQRQKCQLFSRCRSAFLYLHHRAAEILMEGCKVVNCITSHTPAQVFLLEVSHIMEMTWWTSVIINVFSPGPLLCICDGVTCTDVLCRGGLAPISHQWLPPLLHPRMPEQIGVEVGVREEDQDKTHPTSVAATSAEEGFSILFPSLIFLQKGDLMIGESPGPNSITYHGVYAWS